MSAGVPSGAVGPAFDMLVIAASLGGPSAISQVLAGLPADFPAPVLVVQHRTPSIDSRFPEALRYRTPLPVRLARDGEPAATPGAGVLPARHTAVIDAAGNLRLRPLGDHRLTDPLLRSVADYCGPRALCLVLTGRLDDAAEGVRALKCRGGRTIVEDPATARAPEMPAAALATGCVDLVMPLAHLAPALIALTMAPGAADLFRVPPPPWANLAA